MIHIKIIPRTLLFRQPAGTSRGVYNERKIWYLLLTDDLSQKFGVGECAPLPNLSCDDIPDYEDVLQKFALECEQRHSINYEALRSYPSMLFGFETAFRHFKCGNIQLYNTTFGRGERNIPINGLVWMGNFNEMHTRIDEKIKAGFTCIKLKIGAIDFEEELALIQEIRRNFSSYQIELRVDANGAFSPQDAMSKLERLAVYSIHSIEQPIRAGQWNKMAQLCASSPIPIALDEELIGINHMEQKLELLNIIKPAYIILKPSLHGGIMGAEEWILGAKQSNVGYWVTSALESNIGLNAIAQWCATLNPQIPQGLGTGTLFTNNIDYPLEIVKNALHFTPCIDPKFDLL